MEYANHESEVRGLLLSALDGDCTADDLGRLNELLRGSEEARLSAVRFLRDDSLLSEEIGTLEKALSFLQQLPVTLESLPHTSEARRALASDHQLTWAGEDRWTRAGRPVLSRLKRIADDINSRGLMVVAAALLLGIGFFWHYATMVAKLDRLYALTAAKDPEDVAKTRSTRSSASPGTLPVARVTGLASCVWPAGEEGLKFGDVLAPGQRLRLTSGVLQLTYDTGAKVVVEGPVDMEMSTAIEAKLSAGKIAAAVPRFARGYTIVTPTAEVVDLGTEFGVAVDQNGSSEIHVFDGDVVSRPVGEHGSGSHLIHAQGDEAVMFDGGAVGPRRITFDGEKFVRRVTPTVPFDKLPQIPFTEKLALWLAADVMPVMKEGEPVCAWPDILVGDNHFPDDACQFDPRLCPTWVHDGDGRPAIRFDGWSNCLATSPMETGNSQTAFVVFSASPASFASSSHGGILLKYGLNAPTLELAMLTDHTPRGLVWASDDVGTPANVAAVTGKKVKSLVPCAVAYEYDLQKNHAELFVNGMSEGVATAPRPIEQHAKKYIGSHAQPWYEAYFLGNIYEVIVFDVALNQSDRDRIFKYLSTRYGIKLVE